MFAGASGKQGFDAADFTAARNDFVDSHRLTEPPASRTESSAESQRPARVLFFTGTDTDVGKTHVASLAAAELRHSGSCVAVYKPVASGCHEVDGKRISGDGLALWEASGRRDDPDAVCPQRFLASLAPPQAAAAEGTRVDEEQLLRGFDRVAAGAEFVLVEGAGGLLSPLSDDWLNSDLAARIGGQLVIVAANRLGAIHQVLSTVLSAKALGLPVLGIVLSHTTPIADPATDSNAEAIRRWTGTPLLADIPFNGRSTGVDWASLRADSPSDANLASAITRAWL